VAPAEQEFRADTKLKPGNAEGPSVWALPSPGWVHEARAELERSNRLQPAMPETLFSLGKAELLRIDKDRPLRPRRASVWPRFAREQQRDPGSHEH